MNPYETRKLRDEYLLFHFGTADEVLPYAEGPREALGFAIRTVTETLPQTPVGRALDLGCAVGRSAFELSKFCESVIAIDFSSAFIDAAKQLQREGTVDYQRLEEGKVSTPLVARLPTNARPENVHFETGDATHLRPDLGSYDIVHAANLICRLPDPDKLLTRLPALVNPGGTLVITTPCTWLGEFTPPELWPTGPTLQWLERSLAPAFTLTHSKNMPFLIRETARKFQWTVAEASVWTRV
ncbi:MAG: putative 4-mercaptohistidine N1-methyltransferase [Verrucomicrobiae bacterium]|nr:putative 4-mercaptohistidine N1-methyltransferase [Verrucomicrobiae bacterium]